MIKTITIPKLNEKKIVRRFAWWPVNTYDCCRIWLRYYYVVKKCTMVNDVGPDAPLVRWIDYRYYSALYVIPKEL